MLSAFRPNAYMGLDGHVEKGNLLAVENAVGGFSVLNAIAGAMSERNAPYINYGKGDTLAQKRKKHTLAQKSCESPLSQDCRPESANGDLEGYWKHPVPGPGCEE
eukprot:1143556-Pelagomonas_calceolata.AAC.2